MTKVKQCMTWCAASLAVLVGLVVLVGVMLPRGYEVTRAIMIAAPAGDIHQYVGDLKSWELWEPWRESDPGLVVSHGDQTAGVGASQSWVGESGSGSLIFTNSDPAHGVSYDLDFDGGSARCESSILYREDAAGRGTRVTWSMTGRAGLPVVGGYFALIMDSMAGPMFERGLENLKRVVEIPAGVEG